MTRPLAAKLLRIVFASVLILSSFSVALAATNGIDPSFGTNGVVVRKVSSQSDGPADILAQSTGKLLFAGNDSIHGNGVYGYVGRLNADGSLDTAFGSSGFTTQYSSLEYTSQYSSLEYTSLKIAPDGKIVVSGYNPFSYVGNFAVARFLPDGSTDNTFGANGVAETEMGSYTTQALDIAIQADNKIVEVGAATADSNSLPDGFNLIRYNNDGSVDTTFGTQGVVFTSFNNSTATARRVVIQSDGRILVAGLYDTTHGGLALARYNTDGSLDSSFGVAGKLMNPNGISAYAMVLQPDGKIVIGGSISFSNIFALRRYLPDGQVDPTFGGFDPTYNEQHIVTAPFGAAYDLALQPDGKILATAGNATFARFNSDGSRDSTLAPGAMINVANMFPQALTLQMDAKIVAFGFQPRPPDPPYQGFQLVFARANANSACSPTFNDVAAAEYFAQPVVWLYCQGAVSGYSDGSFRPFNNLTRGQLLKILTLATGVNFDYRTTQTFSDLAAADTYYRYMLTGSTLGWVSGYSDGSIHPNADVTRGQMSKIIVQALGWQIDTTGGPHFNDVPTSNPFYQFVETAYHHGVISGYSDGSFRWEASATRGQVSKIIYQALQTNAQPQKAVK